MCRGAAPADGPGALGVSGAATAARRILVVEDESSLAVTLSDRLTSEGYEVELAGDGDAGYAAALEGSFDLILLDLNLPKRSGFDVCRDLRKRGYAQPVLMLTARAQVVDKVVGLKLGGDDYLTKPFEMAELLARVEALLRRTAPANGEAGSFVFGDVRVDFRRAEVTKAGGLVELAPLELKLLRYFIEHRGGVIARSELLEKVWGYDNLPYTRTVDVHVASLRQKLERDPSHPEHILTVRGLGYRFSG